MLAWLKTRIRTFALVPDYFNSVRQHWADVVWGVSVPAIVFILWLSLGNPPQWSIVAFFVWALFVAGYYVWRADHMRLIPKLELGDVFLSKVPTNRFGLERVFAQFQVTCSAQTTLTECRGYLVEIYKWSNNNWVLTEADETLDLLWSIVDEPVRTLEAGIPQRLNIFYVDNIERRINILASKVHFKASAVFENPSPNDIFKFEIRLTAKDCPPAKISLRVQLSEQWDKPKVRPLTPALRS